MNREHRRDKRAPPKRAGHLPQHKKEQDNSQIVQCDVCEMMAAGTETVDLAIEHVADACQRMPETRVSVRPHPRNTVQSQAAADLGVLINILVVIEVDEPVPKRLAKDQPRHRS